MRRLRAIANSFHGGDDDQNGDKMMMRTMMRTMMRMIIQDSSRQEYLLFNKFWRHLCKDSNSNRSQLISGDVDIVNWCRSCMLCSIPSTALCLFF